MSRTLAIICLTFSTALPAAEPGKSLSHPPIRPLPPLSQRPLGTGPAFFVHPTQGNDAANGGEKAPWRTVNHALKQLKPGDTLYLRGGSYFENVYCAVAGKPNAPITIRGYPGERAIIDGGMSEFQTDPAAAWEPAPGGAAGEYRSTKTYSNIRDVVGLFGDSNIGLQTYWHLVDLRAENEFWIDDPEKKMMVKPIYCGPGLWYDKISGRIHVRLAHTKLDLIGDKNYRGETDPRKLPLVITPFKSVPLLVDQAMHVRFQDFVVRGGGHNSVILQQGTSLDFDHVTIFAGTYGLRCRGVGPLKMTHCGLHGMIPPWAFRDENSLFTYAPNYFDPFVPPKKPTNERNIARLPTHAVLVTEGSYEFEVFHYPHNHDWDISHCEFTDGHDGVYLSGSNIRFHHNWVDEIQDDAIYLSSPTPYMNRDLHISENLITGCFSAFAVNSLGEPRGNVYIRRNIVDMRRGIHFSRPTPAKPEGFFGPGHVFLGHGGDPRGVESIYFYQNTFVGRLYNGDYGIRTWTGTRADSKRRVFNNVFVYQNRVPNADITLVPAEHDVQVDGNLHWCSLPGTAIPADFLEKVRTSRGSVGNKKNYPSGWAANDVIGDPKFLAFGNAVTAGNDYRLQKDSPAVGKGIALPKEWEDAQRSKEGKPDIGAFPLGGDAPKYGREGRLTFPITGKPGP